MPQKNELIAYAMDFASYLVIKVGNINQIILHGSIPRGDFDEESDVDIFIDTNEKNAQNKIENALENYYKTTKFKEWELKGIKNSISLIIGKLDSNEWKGLKRAIMNTGIILYGKYKANAEKVNHYTLFSFENITPDKKRIALFRKLFGFKTKNKKYSGLTEKLNLIRIGKGTFLVPIEHVNELKSFFHERKVAVKLYDFWSDYKIE